MVTTLREAVEAAGLEHLLDFVDVDRLERIWTAYAGGSR